MDNFQNVQIARITRRQQGEILCEVITPVLLPRRYISPPLSIVIPSNTPNYNPQLPTFEVLGAGSYGEVIAVSRSDEVEGERVLKRINLLELSRDGPYHVTGHSKYKRLNREIELLQNMNHPNIVRFFGFFHSCDPTPHINIEMERMSLTLKDYYYADVEKLPTERRQHQFISALIAQFLLAAEFLERNNIMHRDIKPANVGLNLNGFRIKLLDFGLARDRNGDEHTHNIGSRFYQAPEVLHGHQMANAYDGKVDLWGIVVTVIEYVYGRPLFFTNTNNLERRWFEVCGLPEDRYRQRFGEVFNGHSPCEAMPIDDYLPPTKMTGEIPTMGCTKTNLYDLVGGMLRINPMMRRSIAECLLHPYVSRMVGNFRQAIPEYNQKGRASQ